MRECHHCIKSQQNPPKEEETTLMSPRLLHDGTFNVTTGHRITSHATSSQKYFWFCFLNICRFTETEIAETEMN